MTKKNVKYCHCLLEKQTGEATFTTQIAYIPKRFALKSRTLRIRDQEGNWESGWVVKTVGAERMEDQLPDSHSQIKHHRNNTGDAISKR